MAHAAEQDLDTDVFRPGIATLDFVESERAVLIDSSIGFGLDHDFSLSVNSRARVRDRARGVTRNVPVASKEYPLVGRAAKKDLCAAPPQSESPAGGARGFRTAGGG